ncbi:MAG: YceK/YidQ family lipoprotein [Planctomycetota bacterium]|nr:YceK/YidQ family lipoprotein [Planctomycetota bacterium]
MSQPLLLVLVLGLAATLTGAGCGTILALREDLPSCGPPYRGVKFDLSFYPPLLFLDLPLSFTLDTVLLPFDLFLVAAKHKRAPERTAPEGSPPQADRPTRADRHFDAPRDPMREPRPLPRRDYIDRERLPRPR